ncbi:MAG: amidohydrolase family protein [Chitinophagaceae bacterium]|nr:amidohydrolase family protein [Chitinophagaceae bacterium]
MRLLSFLIGILLLQSATAQVLIKNVNVVDVEGKKILAGYNVVALDGKIVSIDKDKMYKLPDGTEVIDGSGKYLMPGLTDAHVHFFQSGGIYTRPDVIDLRKYKPHSAELDWVHTNMEDFLRRYSSIGITSVIDVGASLSPFAIMETEEGVRQSVRDQLPLHTDFIKIWYIVLDKDLEAGARKNLPFVKAAIDEAHKNKLRVAVHATERITAQLAVEAGADFLVHSVADEILSNEFVQLLKKNKTVLCPTIVVVGNYDKALGNTYHFNTHELSVANPVTVGSILDYPLPDTALAAKYIAGMGSPLQKKAGQRTDSIMMANLKLLIDAGVTIATGTDAGNIGTQHASSYYEELKAMKQAGMSNWQILEASTINGAKAVGEEKQWGSIAKDKLANMLLLEKNPLDDIANLLTIEWVINKGFPMKPSSFVQHTPTILAQQQLNAFNAHDLEAFLEPYAEDVEIYTFPSTLEMKGKVEMRKNYQFVTQLPKLYCNLINRIVQDNIVIDQEEVFGLGEKPVYGIAIYIIEKGKIKKVYFSNKE